MRSAQQGRRRRGRTRTVLGAATVLGLAGATLATMGSASAGVGVTPAFPDNIVVFPDRDFVSVEGYDAPDQYVGDTALVEVTRPSTGQVVGSARAVVAEGGVAFEVNHPGGVCWGAGTTLKVTPDIKAGDVVSVTFPDGRVEQTTTSSATVSANMTRTGNTVTVDGTFGPEVDPAFLEQRIINPDLVPILGKRDVRALPGPLVAAPRGGYSSGIDVDATAHTFTARYVFDTVEAATTVAAADLGERAMSWQVEDADGNRQGLTISEFGEAGGPGMGGCPAGPVDQAPPAGEATVTRAAGATTLQVGWTPAAVSPGAPAVDGFSVEAIAVSGTAAGDIHVQQGVRTGKDVRSATISGLSATESYDVEVRSLAAGKMSAPFTVTTGPVDVTAPSLSVTPVPATDGTAVATDKVAVTSNEEVFLTTGDTPVVLGDMPSDAAQLYTGPVPVTSPVTFNFAAFDEAGLWSQVSGDYVPGAGPAPVVPAKVVGLVAGTPTQTSVPLTWTAPTDPSVTGYQVTAYAADGTTKLPTQPPVTAVARQTVSNLDPGTPYVFKVQAKNADGLGPASDPVSVTTQAASDRITITSAKWKTTDFRVVGTGSRVGVSVQAYVANPDGTLGAEIPGASTTVVAAAPPGIGAYDIRLRTGVPNPKPARVFVKSTGGGIAGPFAVANG